MKSIIILVSIAIILTGCHTASSEDTDTEISESGLTLVFFDRSASVEGQEAGTAYNRILNDLVRTNLSHSGDQLRVYFLHEKTLGKVNRLELINTINPPVDEYGGSIDRVIAEKAYTENTKKLIAEKQAEVMRFCWDTPVPRDVARYTDLTSSLEIINEAIKRSNNPEVQAYFLSDMFESMPGPDRRDFDRRPPANRAEAEQWATEDVEWIKQNLDVDPALLNRMHLVVQLGPHGNKDGSENVKRYWMKLWTEVGLDPARILYN